MREWKAVGTSSWDPNMIYDLTILSLLPNTLGAVLPILPQTYAGYTQSGRVLGCFSCEFGVLNRFAFLAAYDSVEALTEERARLMQAENPYGIGEHLGGVSSTAFKPLFFMDDIVTGQYGPFYEFRTYTLAPGGLPETAEAWSKVVERRNTMSKLLMVMGSIEEGPQKMVHIWPYASIEDRMAARGQASKEGIWPPPGGSGKLTALQSELFVATGFSDLK
jgi:hypothetical protein